MKKSGNILFIRNYSIRNMSGKADSKDSVYNYLKLQNRPYSANDVMLNLHNEFGKTAVQKALDDLSRESKIREKIYGKQKVYSIIQEENDSVSDADSEILQLDSKIEKLADCLKSCENELKINESALKDLKKQPSLKECTQEKCKLEEDIKVLSEKFENLPDLDVNVIERERKEICEGSEKYVKEYKKRKRICMDILNSILENFPKPKKALYEEIGIETDEDVGFTLSSY